ncbi:MAG: hydrolase [Bacteroides sp.]|nr:hydrolase [Bacteroides sp.]
MKRLLTSFAVIALTVSAAVAGVKWHSADTLPLLGKCVDHASTSLRYQRIPDSLQSQVKRPYLFTLGKNSAGMALRFRSDSPSIHARWKSVFSNKMNHMTLTGTRGLDLYMLQPDSTWTFVQSARPDIYKADTETCVITNMEPAMREYMLYLSLYDGVDSLYIGTDDGYGLQQPAVSLPAAGDPIVFYGTSILQGGCASRPGMAHTNILSRRLNREAVNLGFSGNGQLDLEIARLIAATPDPSLVVLDFVPNVNYEQIDTLMVPFVDIIRQSHPTVPILVLEDPDYPTKRFDTTVKQPCDNRRRLLREKFDMLQARYGNMYYQPTVPGMLGKDAEQSVDGIHFTDVGFLRYSDALQPIIQSILSTQ